MNENNLIEAMAQAIKKGNIDNLLVKARELALTTNFSIFKTIKLGTYSNADELRGALKATGNRIGDWANKLLGKIKIAQQVTEIDLVMATVAELGFPDGATFRRITDRIKKLDYQLCLAEAAALLRVTHASRPVGEILIMAMEPIRSSGGDLSVFVIGQYSDGPWLCGYYGGPDSFWGSDRRFVFVRPRN